MILRVQIVISFLCIVYVYCSLKIVLMLSPNVWCFSNLVYCVVQTDNRAEQLLRTVDSVGDSLRRSLGSGSNISNKLFVQANIVVQVNRVTDLMVIRFPDNSSTESSDWFAKTESHLVLSSDAFAGFYYPSYRLLCKNRCIVIFC